MATFRDGKRISKSKARRISRASSAARRKEKTLRRRVTNVTNIRKAGFTITPGRKTSRNSNSNRRKSDQPESVGTIQLSDPETGKVVRTFEVKPQPVLAKGVVKGKVYTNITKEEVRANTLASNTKARVLPQETALRTRILAAEKKKAAGTATSADLFTILSSGRKEIDLSAEKTRLKSSQFFEQRGQFAAKREAERKAAEQKREAERKAAKQAEAKADQLKTGLQKWAQAIENRESKLNEKERLRLKKLGITVNNLDLKRKQFIKLLEKNNVSKFIINIFDREIKGYNRVIVAGKDYGTTLLNPVFVGSNIVRVLEKVAFVGVAGSTALREDAKSLIKIIRGKRTVKTKSQATAFAKQVISDEQINILKKTYTDPETYVFAASFAVLNVAALRVKNQGIIQVKDFKGKSKAKAGSVARNQKGEIRVVTKGKKYLKITKAEQKTILKEWRRAGSKRAQRTEVARAAKEVLKKPSKKAAKVLKEAAAKKAARRTEVEISKLTKRFNIKGKDKTKFAELYRLSQKKPTTKNIGKVRKFAEDAKITQLVRLLDRRIARTLPKAKPKAKTKAKPRKKLTEKQKAQAFLKKQKAIKAKREAQQIKKLDSAAKKQGFKDYKEKLRYEIAFEAYRTLKGKKAIKASNALKKIEASIAKRKAAASKKRAKIMEASRKRIINEAIVKLKKGDFTIKDDAARIKRAKAKFNRKQTKLFKEYRSIEKKKVKSVSDIQRKEQIIKDWRAAKTESQKTLLRTVRDKPKPTVQTKGRVVTELKVRTRVRGRAKTKAKPRQKTVQEVPRPTRIATNAISGLSKAIAGTSTFIGKSGRILSGKSASAIDSAIEDIVEYKRDLKKKLDKIPDQLPKQKQLLRQRVATKQKQLTIQITKLVNRKRIIKKTKVLRPLLKLKIKRRKPEPQKSKIVKQKGKKKKKKPRFTPTIKGLGRKAKRKQVRQRRFTGLETRGRKR